jgi:hypothetical protein
MPLSRNSSSTKKGVPATATLVAHVAVVVVDVSRCGVLIETTRPLDSGTIGTLQLVIDGSRYVEDFRVARCTALSGRGSTYRIGIEFLRTRRESDMSLRHAVTHLVARNAGGTTSNGGERPAEHTGVQGVKHEHAQSVRAVSR